MKFQFLHPPTIPDPPDHYRVALYKRVEAMGGPPFQVRTVSIREKEGVWYARAERVYQGRAATETAAIGSLLGILSRHGYVTELVPPKTYSRWEMIRMMRAICPKTHPDHEIDSDVAVETIAYTGEVVRKLLKLPLDGSAEGGERGENLNRGWELDEIEASR